MKLLPAPNFHEAQQSALQAFPAQAMLRGLVDKMCLYWSETDVQMYDCFTLALNDTLHQFG